MPEFKESFRPTERPAFGKAINDPVRPFEPDVTEKRLRDQYLQVANIFEQLRHIAKQHKPDTTLSTEEIEMVTRLAKEFSELTPLITTTFPEARSEFTMNVARGMGQYYEKLSERYAELAVATQAKLDRRDPQYFRGPEDGEPTEIREVRFDDNKDKLVA